MTVIRFCHNDENISPLVHIGINDERRFGRTCCGWNYKIDLTLVNPRMRAVVVDEAPTCLWCVVGREP